MHIQEKTCSDDESNRLQWLLLGKSGKIFTLSIVLKNIFILRMNSCIICCIQNKYNLLYFKNVFN